jgi:reactive intermediate/imine deaminase
MKKIIFTAKAPKAIGPYSQAVEANGTLYVSGQIPIDPATGKLVEGGIQQQTEQVMKNIAAILEAAGYSFKDVMKSVLWSHERGLWQFLSAGLPRPCCLCCCEAADGSTR